MQPELGEAMVRSKTLLDEVAAGAEAEAEAEVGDEICEDIGAGDETALGQESLAAERALVLELLLRSSVLPMKPPARPAMIIRSNP